MNPDRTNSGTVNGWLRTGLYTSTIIPVLFFIVVLALLYWNVPNSQMSLFVLAFLAASAFFVILFNSLVQRRVNGHIRELTSVCQDYASGDRSARAPVNGNDDFAQLSNSLNIILDNQGTATPTMATGNASGSEAAALQAQIEKLLQEVSAVGDGDLRVQAEVTPDTLGVLADSFNYMIEELAKVVGRVQTTAVQVTNATRRILDRSDELARASETQVRQIAQTTEAVEALAVFIQNVARNAQVSVDVAQEALRSANVGQQAVRQSIEGMLLIRENVQETSKKIKRLGERSNEIGEIVRIIEDIADQTNLLALNAAIQSAMAGEHGRGFAVVADEIRVLAERSTESTKQIATLVKSIQGDTYEAVVAMEDSTQEVVKGSQLADDAGRSLNSIYEAVEKQAQMIESIARAANDQTSVSEAVAVAMGRISEITRQTDAGTQEAAVSVSYLAELSEQLRSSVSTFRLPEQASDVFSSFSAANSVNEVPDRGNQLLAPPSSGSFSEDGWSQQSYPSGFPPLPEGNDADAFAPLNGRADSYQFDSGANFSQAASPSGARPAFSAQNGFGNGSMLNNEDFMGNGLPAFSENQFAGNSANFGNPNFGNQFRDFSPFGSSDQGGNLAVGISMMHRLTR